MKKLLWIALSLFFFFVSPGLGFTEGAGGYSIAGFDDSAKVEQFVKKLQEWVAQDKKEEIANVIRFPLNVQISGRRIALRNKNDFLRRYSEVFNSRVKDAVLKQDSSNLFGNWQGAMIGNGEIWIHPGNDSIKIITINN